MQRTNAAPQLLLASYPEPQRPGGGGGGTGGTGGGAGGGTGGGGRAGLAEEQVAPVYGRRPRRHGWNRWNWRRRGGKGGTGGGTGGGTRGGTGELAEREPSSGQLECVQQSVYAHSTTYDSSADAGTGATNQQILQALADGTGGFAIYNTNDLLGGLQRIANEQNEFYLLGYVPPDSAEGTCHTLKVK